MIVSHYLIGAHNIVVQHAAHRVCLFLPHSTMCVDPSSPCSSPETLAKITVERSGPRPTIPGRVSKRAHSTLTAVPEASSSAQHDVGDPSRPVARLSKCPETMNTVFASAASEPGRIRNTFKVNQLISYAESWLDSPL